MTTARGCRFRRWFWVPRGDDGGAADLVVGFVVQQTHAGGGAAGGPDTLGVDADDFAELADDHHLGGVVDELDACDFADLGVGFMLMTPLPPRDWRR